MFPLPLAFEQSPIALGSSLPQHFRWLQPCFLPSHSPSMTLPLLDVWSASFQFSGFAKFFSNSWSLSMLICWYLSWKISPFWKVIFIYAFIFGWVSLHLGFLQLGWAGGYSLAGMLGLLIAVTSLVAEHGLESLQATVVVAQGHNRSTAWRIFLDQGLNPCPLQGRQIVNHWTIREVLESISFHKIISHSLFKKFFYFPAANSFLFLKNYLFILSLTPVLCFHCCTQTFSSCSEQGLLRSLLIAVASFLVKHRL